MAKIVFPTTTTTTKPCNPTINSVTLKKDQTFVLPKGAKIISASDTTKIQTTCPSIDLASIEKLQCYEIVITGNAEQNSIPYSEDRFSDFRIEGFLIKGVFYGVPEIAASSAGAFNLSSLVSFIQNQANVLYGMIYNPCWEAVGDDNLNQGGQTALVFKTIPSIANDMYIKTRTNLDDGGVMANAYYKAVPFGTITGQPGWGKYERVGNCSCS